jgi:RNA polymerase sigma factor (sigma-70 family)
MWYNMQVLKGDIVEKELNINEQKDESLDLYYNDINNSFNETEDIELLKRSKKGDLEAREILINKYLKEVIRICKRMKVNNYDLADMIQEGNIGLIYAVDNCDPEYFANFHAYMQMCVYTNVIKNRANNLYDIRLYSKVNELVNKINTYIYRYEKKYGEKPSNNMISNELGIEEKIVNYLLNIINPISIEEIPFEEMFYYDDDVLFLNAYSNEVMDIVNNSGCLNERELFVIKSRYGFFNNICYRYETIGKKLNVSKYRASQIENESLKKLRRYSKLLEKKI